MPRSRPRKKRTLAIQPRAISALPVICMSSSRHSGPPPAKSRSYNFGVCCASRSSAAASASSAIVSNTFSKVAEVEDPDTT